MPTLPPEVESVLVSVEQISDAVDELAERINADYADQPIVAVGALTGAAVFAADLIRRLTCPVMLDFVSVSSYGRGSVPSGTIAWEKELSVDVRGRQVLLMEDIVDTGETLVCLQSALSAAGAAGLRTCALLSKPARRRVEVTVEYLGLEIPDEFVVGYGLDYAQRFRNLPYIGVLKRSVYAPAEVPAASSGHEH